MIRIKFKDKKDEARGFYLLAYNGQFRALRGGIYEIQCEMKELLNKENLIYEEIPRDEKVNEAEAIRNPLTVNL